jgi:hypothetical protein
MKIRTGLNALQTNPKMIGPMIVPKSSDEPYNPTCVPYREFGAISGIMAKRSEVAESPTETAIDTRNNQDWVPATKKKRNMTEDDPNPTTTTSFLPNLSDSHPNRGIATS